MTDKIILTNKEIHKLFRFSELEGKANVVLGIKKTPIGNIYYIASQNDYKRTLQSNFAIDWKDITSYEEW